MQGETIMIYIYICIYIYIRVSSWVCNWIFFLSEFAEQVFLLNFHSFFKQICSALQKQALGFHSSALTALMLPHVCCHVFAATCLLPRVCGHVFAATCLRPRVCCHVFAANVEASSLPCLCFVELLIKKPTPPPTISLPPHPPHQSLQQASQRNLFNEVSWFARTLMIAFQSKYSLFLYSLFLLSEH